MRRESAVIVVLATMSLCGSVRPVRADDAPPLQPVADRVQKDVFPLLQKYCLSCHSAELKKGGVDLSPFATELAVLRARRKSENVLRVLRAEEMPPDDQPQPTAQERELLLTAIDDTLHRVDCSQRPEPGRVTIRRLNRTEYNNTIRDLVGVPFQPADDFPADDIGYGFDHIGDVLSLPPLLFEKYMAAAERIMDVAIREGEIINGPIRRFSSRTMKWTGPDEAPFRGKYGRVISPNGELQAELETARAYEYIANVRMYGGNRDGSESPKAVLRLDGRDLAIIERKDRRNANFPIRITIPAGKHVLSFAVVKESAVHDADRPDPPPLPDEPFARLPQGRIMLEFIDMQGPIDTSPTLSEQLILICRPAADGHDAAACARKIIEHFATRAFRRQATDSEVDLFQRVYEDQRAAGESYERGLRLALAAVLVSPKFLFRVEADPASSEAQPVRSLDDFELASRLSYFLWSSMPDEELLALAAKGELHRTDVLRDQVRRMLRDPRRTALISNFAGQWLQLRNLSVLAPSKEMYPNFDDSLRQAMRRETELFFESIVAEDRSVLEFLDAKHTFVNGRLAKHYGWEGIEGDFQRVELPNDQRGGVLTQASVLTVTSNPTRTSPVKRGKWILENLLADAPPPPPPNVKELDESPAEASKGTLRQRMEQHRSNPGCASCHQRMDPLGFGLENFDGIGGWRTKDGSFIIDASGDLPSGETFKTPKELREILLARKDEFTRCLTEKMLTYALGRGLEYYDKCTTDRISDAVKSADYRFSALIEEIVLSDPFLRRRTTRGEK